MQAYRRENGVYYVRLQGRRLSLKTRSRAVADAAVRELELRAVDPSYARAHGVTLELACATFLRDAPTAGNRAKPPAAATLGMWRLHCEHFVRVLGADVALASVDAAAVERYIAQRRSEPVNGKRPGRPRVSAATVDKELSTLRKVLAAAARRGEYHRALDAVLPPRGPVAGRALTRALQWPDEVDRFLAAFSRWDLAAICCFVLGTGADKACIPTARAEDFDFRRGVVLLRGTKTARRHAEVPIVELFAPLVRRAYAFLVAHGAFPRWVNSTRDMARACAAAGVPRVTLRDLRRTVGRTLRRRGIPPSLIGVMLRHADGRMAEVHYAQLEPADLGAQIAAAERLPLIDLPPVSESATLRDGSLSPRVEVVHPRQRSQG